MKFYMFLTFLGISCVSAQVFPSGGFRGSVARNFRISGGYDVISIDFRDCYDKCIDDENCFAIDFDYQYEQCYHHDQRTGCNAPVFARGLDHYQLFDCTTGQKHGDLERDMSARPPPGEILALGDIVEGGANFEACLSLCYQNTSCVGLDYEPNRRRCMHSYSVQDSCYLLNSNGWSHYRFVPCILPDVVRETPAPSINNCENSQQASTIDLMIVLDRSGSICGSKITEARGSRGGYTCETWKQVISFLYDLVGLLPIGPRDDEVAIGIVTFSNYARLDLPLNTNPIEVRNAISKLENENIRFSATNTYEGLALAYRQLNSSRKDVKDVAILITDEPANLEVGEEFTVAETMHNENMIIYAVGAGPGSNPSYLEALSSPPKKREQNYFVSPNLAVLGSSLNGMITGAVSCEAPVVQTCERAQLDILFVVDSSGSICNQEPVICQNWLNVVSFIKEVAQQMRIGPTHTQIGLIRFSTNAEIKWYLDDYQDLTSLLKVITNMNSAYRGGGTNVQEAFELARDVFSGSGNRISAKDYIIFITDGIPNINIDGTLPSAIAVKNQNINIISIGITRNVDAQKLKEISSPPQVEGETYFLTPNFDELNSILDGLINKACDKKPQVPVKESPCETVNLDIVFILDASGSVCNNQGGGRCENWDEVIDFVARIVNSPTLSIGRSHSQVGVIIFSSTAQIMWHLDQYNTKTTLLGAIETLRGEYQGGTTNIGAALELLMDEMYGPGVGGDRALAFDLAVFLTDGFPNEEAETTTLNLAQEVKKRGIEIIAIAIGDNYDRSVIAGISSDPQAEGTNYFIIDNFQQLDFKLERITRQVCEDDGMTPTTEPPVPVCNAKFELVFLVDGSGSVCATEANTRNGGCASWEAIIKFVEDIVKRFDIGQDDTRVSLILFATRAFTMWDLNRHDRSSKLLLDVQALRNAYPGGATDTPGALELALNVLRDARSDAVPIVVLVTDGRPNINRDSVWDLANQVQSLARLIPVGVNNKVDEEFLMSMSSPPQESGSSYFTRMDFLMVNETLSKINKDNCEKGTTTTTTPRTPRATQGTGCSGIDLTFVVDASGSICDNDPTWDRQSPNCTDWHKMLTFIHDIVGGLDISGSDRDRVALVKFSNYELPEWGLNGFTSKGELQRTIKSLFYPGGNTNLFSALRYTRNNIYANDFRPNAPKIVIIISDGNPTVNVSETQPEADRLKQIAEIYAVGIGDKIQESIIKNISSAPQIKGLNYMMSPDFNNLNDILSAIATKTSEECKRVTPASTESPMRTFRPPGTTESPMRTFNPGPTSRVGRPTVPTRSTTRRTTVTTPRGPFVPQECKIDLVFIVDGSGSICDNDPLGFIDDMDTKQGCHNWKDLKKSMISMVNGIRNIGPNGVQVAVVTFGNNGKVAFNFTKYNTKSKVIDALNTNVAYPGGNTNTQGGLRIAREEVFNIYNGDRPWDESSDVVLLFTDGAPTVSPSETGPQAMELKNLGVRIYTLGITDQVDWRGKNYLREISSDPNREGQNWFVADSFAKLQSATAQIFQEVVPSACRV